MLTRLPFALGPLEGHRLAIDVPVLTQVLGGLIRSGALVGGAGAAVNLLLVVLPRLAS